MSKKGSLVLSVLFGIIALSSTAVFSQMDVPAAGIPENKTIFSYKTELNMTDKQEKDLRAVLDGFQKYFEEKKNALISTEQGISELVNAKGDLGAIRKKIDELAKLKADVTFKDIETSRSVEGILKPEQIEQWKKIQTEAIDQLRKQMAEQAPAPAEVTSEASK